MCVYQKLRKSIIMVIIPEKNQLIYPLKKAQLESPQQVDKTTMCWQNRKKHPNSDFDNWICNVIILGCSAPSDTFTTQLSTLRFREHQRQERKIVRGRRTGVFSECLLNKTAVYMKSQNHPTLKYNCTMTTRVYMQMQIRGMSQDPNLG